MQGRAPRPPESVVYLGLNDASRGHEASAFRGMRNATVIDGAGSDPAMQGKTMGADGKTVLDLATEGGVQQFLQESGIGNLRTGADGQATESDDQAAQRMQALQSLFLGELGDDGQRTGGINVGARDEMADYVRVLQGVETGQRTMDRVVMSGHSTGEWVYSEAEGNPGVTFEQMAQLMGQFPRAQGGVEDLMLSACHTLEGSSGNADGEQYRNIFPNVESVWGYDGFSPSFKQGSVSHIRNWLKASAGDDPNAVARAAARQGQNATAVTFP